MRTTIAIGLGLLVLLAGCSRSTPPSAVRVAGPNNPAGNPGPGEPGYLGGSQTPLAGHTYQGRTPAQWEQGLLESRDHRVRHQAGQALAALGEKGYPHLVNGMRSPDPEVRLQAMQAMPRGMLVEHQDEMVRTLLSMLRDNNPAVREQAALRLSWVDGKTADFKGQPGLLPQERARWLEVVATSDPDPQVRSTASHSLTCVKAAMSGKVTGD